MISNKFDPAKHVRVGELEIDQVFIFEGAKYRIEGFGRSGRSSRTNGTVQVYNYGMKRCHCLTKRSIVNRRDLLPPEPTHYGIDLAAEGSVSTEVVVKSNMAAEGSASVEVVVKPDTTPEPPATPKVLNLKNNQQPKHSRYE